MQPLKVDALGFTLIYTRTRENRGRGRHSNNLPLLYPAHRAFKRPSCLSKTCIMARCLSTYHWAKDPLNGEVPYQNADVLVEDSDIYDSPSTKAERIRRREAIGRRYLLGYVPLIQTASLRGPFDSKSGWVSPWKGIQRRGKAQKSTRTRDEFEAISNREAPTTESETLRAHDTTEAHVDEDVDNDIDDEHNDDDAMHYDADNEDENFEQTSDEERCLPDHWEHVDIGRVENTHISHGERQSLNNNDSVSNSPKKYFERQIRCKSTRSPAGAEQVLSQNGKKRQVDMSWLKGANTQKRSRYEVLEHLSPTPAAGFIREDDRGRQIRLLLQTSGLKTPKRLEQLQVLQKPSIYQLRAEGELTDNTSTSPAIFDGLSSKVTAGSTHGLLMGGAQIINGSSHQNFAMSCSDASCLTETGLPVTQYPQQDKPMRQKKPKQGTSTTALAGPNITPSDCETRNELAHSNEQLWKRTTASREAARSTTSVCQGMDHNDLPQDDIHRQPRASQLTKEGASLPTITRTPWRREPEVVQLSPSDLDDGDNAHLSAIRQLLHKGARLTKSPAKDQLFDNTVYGTSAMTEFLGDKPTVLPNPSSTMAFSETPSPASEVSFQYRKTNRKSQKRGGEEKEAGTRRYKSLALQSIDPSMCSSRASTSSSNSKDVVARDNSRWKRGGKRQSPRTSPQSNLSLLDELYRVSSPDPISDDFGHDCQRRIVPPDINPDTTQDISEQFQHNNAATDGQRIAVTQARLNLRPHPNGTTSASQGRPQLSNPQAFRGNLEQSKNLILPTQCQLCDSHAEQPLLLDQDKKSEGRGFDSNSRTSSQPKSPKIDSSPTELPQDIQQPVPLTIQPVEPKLNTKLRSRPDFFRQNGSSSENTPAPVDAQAVEELPRSTQSPWTATDIVPLQLVPLSGFQARGSDTKKNRVTRRDYNDHPTENTASERLPFEPEGKAGNDDTERNEDDDSMRIFGTIIDYSPQLSNEMVQPGACFPSTQTLVDATTANPWGSAFKKPKVHKSDKRVSFGPLLSEEVEDCTTSSSSRPPLRMVSPPPPADIQRLAQLEDLEILGKSPTNFMKTPWGDIRKHRAKPPPNSPAVDAMAEAFIAADQHSLSKKVDIRGKSEPTRRMLTTTDGTENIIQPRIREEPARPELKSSSPPDASFSIAPCGKVTAINIEAPGFDAEDNFQAVLEDMGSFLGGWDVESEMKKAKGHNNNDIKGQRKREYLSGVSNR